MTRLNWKNSEPGIFEASDWSGDYSIEHKLDGTWSAFIGGKFSESFETLESAKLFCLRLARKYEAKH